MASEGRSESLKLTQMTEVGRREMGPGVESLSPSTSAIGNRFEVNSTIIG